MKVKDVFVLDEASDDLNKGKNFYDFQEIGIGECFWDCLISDIESLVIYAGIHKKKFGLHQMFSKRFPYTIYYEIAEIYKRSWADRQSSVMAARIILRHSFRDNDALIRRREHLLPVTEANRLFSL